MILDKAGVASYSDKAIGYVVTELASTVIFGLVTVGSREYIENVNTFAAAFAKFLAGENADYYLPKPPALTATAAV